MLEERLIALEQKVREILERIKTPPPVEVEEVEEDAAPQKDR